MQQPPPTRLCPRCATVAQTPAESCPRCSAPYRRRSLAPLAFVTGAFTTAAVLGGVLLMLAAFGSELETTLDEEVERVEQRFDREVEQLERSIRRQVRSELDRRLPVQPATNP